MKSLTFESKYTSRKVSTLLELPMSMKIMSWAGRKILERSFKLSIHSSSQCLRKITSNPGLYTASNYKKELSSDDVRSFKALLPELINELTYDGIHKDMPNVNPYLAQVCLL